MTMIIDVSYHQGVIDWSKVGKEIDYAILRCGYGSNSKENDDKKFYYNATKCEKYGIPYGVYLYSYAKTKQNIIGEVTHIIRLIKDRKVKYPIYLDMEETSIAKTGVYEELAKVFVSMIRATGRKAGLYSGDYIFGKYLKNVDCDSKWVARYSYNVPNTDYDIWQYTSQGYVNGIIGNVDCNKGKDKLIFSDYFYDCIVNDVLDGKYGNGQKRKEALFDKGINYMKVQHLVNVLYSM